jgi:hypothetical protein
MATLEIALVLALVAASAWYAWQSSAGLPRAAAVLIAASGLIVLATHAVSRRRPDASTIPLRRDASGAVGSGACRSCHPSEYASWHRSFHRTMTQVATPATVLGPWNGVKLDVEGRTLELFERGDALLARMPDPELVAAANRTGNSRLAAEASLVTRPVLLATGSHHQQVFWVGDGHGNELRLLPISYLIDSHRYVARRDAFLQPPAAPQHAVRWNSNCIQCHATRGEPRLDDATNRFDSSAVELGIACEACHGPGGAHVAEQHSPLTRFASHARRAPDASIVNPARLASERASAVCGQCHAYFVPRDENRWWHSGFDDFRPGDALEPTRTLLAPETTGAPDAPAVDAATTSLFWNDGTIRVGGREYNGMVRSACFTRGHGSGQISCISCHSLHDSEPDDQLRHGESVDAACMHCHANEGAHVAEHTRHAPGSSGSSCAGCHMPYTSYALLGAIRSHRIDIPSPLATATNGRPNACNLCHLDRTLAWSADALAKWYGAPATAPPADEETARRRARALASTNARAVEELLSGDAATRAIVAAAFGRNEAALTTDGAWEARVLAELLDDPYAAVRKVACDALRRTPNFVQFPCDFEAEADARRATRATAVERATALANGRRAAWIHEAGDAVTVDERIRALAAERDDRDTTISE